MKAKKPLPVSIVPSRPLLPKPKTHQKITSGLVDILGSVAMILLLVEGFVMQFLNRDLQAALAYYLAGVLVSTIARYISGRIKYPDER